VVPEDLTRNEIRFLEVEGITPLTLSLAEAVGIIIKTEP